MDANSILSLLDKGGVVGLLVVLFVGGLRKWWVFGWSYTEALAREQEWKTLALTGTKIAEKVVAKQQIPVDNTTLLDELVERLREERG